MFVTLNLVNPALLARASNRTLPRFSRKLKEADILKRNWLLVKVEPVRPEGISSTDGELETALAAASQIRDDLTPGGKGRDRQGGQFSPVPCPAYEPCHDQQERRLGRLLRGLRAALEAQDAAGRQSPGHLLDYCSTGQPAQFPGKVAHNSHQPAS